jgi:hypothetical protein
MKDYFCLFPSLSAAQMASDDFKKEGGLIAHVDFGKAWTEAGDDPVMRQVQDQYEEEAYFEPAIKLAADLGLTTPLGVAYVYDGIVQMKADLLFPAIQKDFAQVHGGREKPANFAEEAEWLQIYLKERRAELSATPVGAATTGRVDSLQQLLDFHNFDLQLPLTFTYENISFSVGASAYSMQMQSIDSSRFKYASSLLRRRKN